MFGNVSLRQKQTVFCICQNKTMASANVGIKEEPGEGVGLEQRLVLDNYSFGYYRSFIDCDIESHGHCT